MVKVSVFYPNEEGKTFDMSYYCNSHIPMVRQLFGSSCTNASVDQGISGISPGSKATYVAVGHLYFNTVDDFISSFTQHANAITSDFVNYTEVNPIIQISDIIL